MQDQHVIIIFSPDVLILKFSFYELSLIAYHAALIPYSGRIIKIKILVVQTNAPKC